MRFSDLRNRRVAILGAGREGRAVWRRLRGCYPGRELSLFAESAIDESFAGELQPGLDRVRVGPLAAADLERFDVLVRSAGISPYRRELRQLQSRGCLFTTASSLWFAENPAAKTVCVTGTKGKSTTAALIAHLLGCAGAKTCLAGNIGRPMLDCDGAGVDWWVIELSSYQIADLEAAPGIALVLNLSEEHIDWHGGAEQYARDKLRLLQLAGPGRSLANFADPVLRTRLRGQPGLKWFNHADTWRARDGRVLGGGDREIVPPAALPGEHNLHNLAAALTVAEWLGLLPASPEAALADFAGLPHRLQCIGEKEGVRYVDDSISTTPVSVSAALQTVGYERTVLLLGGKDRGLDWRAFAGGLAGRPPHAIITLPDNGPAIFSCLAAAGVRPEGGLHQCASLREAVALAQGLAPPNGCILLSPGAPSFPHFRDFEDRGNQFRKYAGIATGV